MATSSTGSDNLLPECVVFPARKTHTATVIISHGLGDSAKNFAYYMKDFQDHPDLEHVKFILPSAPLMSVTHMHGRIIPSWADVYSFDYVNRREDEDGLFRSAGWIKQLIAKEETEHNIPSNRVVIGGLSQGGSISILTTLTTDKPLAGLFALSTYIPLRHKVPELVTSSAKNIPILWCHGTGDMQVSFDDWKPLAEALAGQLSIPFLTSDYPQSFPAEDQGVNTKNDDGTTQDISRLHFRSYEDMGHTIETPELLEVAAWIARRIPGGQPQIKMTCVHTLRKFMLSCVNARRSENDFAITDIFTKAFNQENTVFKYVPGSVDGTGYSDYVNSADSGYNQYGRKEAS